MDRWTGTCVHTHASIGTHGQGHGHGHIGRGRSRWVHVYTRQGHMGGQTDGHGQGVGVYRGHVQSCSSFSINVPLAKIL